MSKVIEKYDIKVRNGQKWTNREGKEVESTSPIGEVVVMCKTPEQAECTRQFLLDNSIEMFLVGNVYATGESKVSMPKAWKKDSSQVGNSTSTPSGFGN